MELRRELRIVYVVLKGPPTDGGAAGISLNEELPVPLGEIQKTLTGNDVDYFLLHREKRIPALFRNANGTFGAFVKGVSEVNSQSFYVKGEILQKF
jgi:hypothetical protein|tara:strand:+ start:2857 stop:3144 length:288 start_codon:yes stop_codon:yes gene_type:complete